jgi:hypothetical protein
MSDTNVAIEDRMYSQSELDSEIEFALAEQLKNLPLVNMTAATDDVRIRVLNVQEFDKERENECTEHLFLLGLSARENSIKATRKRNAAEKLLEATNKFSDYLRINPEVASDPVRMIAAMRNYGLAPAAQPQASQTK